MSKWLFTTDLIFQCTVLSRVAVCCLMSRGVLFMMDVLFSMHNAQSRRGVLSDESRCVVHDRCNVNNAQCSVESRCVV